MIEHSYWIVLFPLISSIAIFFLGRWLYMNGAILGILSIGYGLCHSLGIFYELMVNPAAAAELRWPWFQFGIFPIDFGIMIDGLTAVMLVVVTLVSLLVHIYSLAYMEGDPRFKRYYAYLSFFTFSMLLLVVSDNLFQMFMGWELVGVASYLLIGFWFEKESAASAGKKAFITTKFGDLGFMIAILMLMSPSGPGTLIFSQLERHIANDVLTHTTAGIIALLLFCGAIGKSAQFPLFVWLPDAMEGPTPVSALIHAATMVAAGVYMVARTYFIFAYGGFSLEVVAYVGGITAFMAATMALVATDIKRVLAFSTVSQLGYMMLAMGVGGREAGMFHLTTHAFFKALLFLGAGSVIHATHTNDIREMGGLSKKMLGTFLTFGCAWLAISGFPLTSGYFSKDAILEAAHHSGHHFLFWLTACVAMMTAFYMTRLFLLVFVTEPRNNHIFAHAHESPKRMVLPMAVLAVLSLVVGAVLQYGVNITAFLGGHAEEVMEGAEHASKWFVPGVSICAALSGMVLGYLIYARQVVSAAAVAETFKPVYDLLIHKYWLDEIYMACIIRPADGLSRMLAALDFHVFDQFGVDGVGWVTFQLAQAQDWMDKNIVDASVDLWGTVCQTSGAGLRRLQTGVVQNYLLIFVLGFLAMMFWRFRGVLCAAAGL